MDDDMIVIRRAAALAACLMVLAAPALAALASVAPPDARFGSNGLTIAQVSETLAALRTVSKDPSGAARRLDAVRNALDDWYGKYPNDPLLPRNYALLCSEIGNLPAGAQRGYDAQTCARNFSARFPASNYATYILRTAPTPPVKIGNDNGPTASEVVWSGKNTVDLRLYFGGGGYCLYRATLTVQRFTVRTDAKGSVTGGELDMDMVEELRSECPYPPLGHRTLRYAVVEGRFGADGATLHLVAQKSNQPQTTADFVGAPYERGFTGSMVLTRVDSADPVNWHIRFPVVFTAAG